MHDAPRTDQLFEIRRFLPEDEPQLMKAWSEAYPELFRFKFPARWNWNMFQNPFVTVENRPLCWVAVLGGHIAAWSCAMAVPLFAAGRDLIGGHSVDTFTLERYRCYGLGRKLQERNQAAHSLFIAIDPSPPNRRNKYKVGGLPGKPLETWLLIGSSLDRAVLYRSFLDLGTKYFGGGCALLSRVLQRLGTDRLLCLMCSALLRRRQTFSRNGTATFSNLRFEAVDVFGEEADAVWDRTTSCYSFAIARRSHYLNWKYAPQPYLEHRKFLVRRDEVPVGILVYRFPDPFEQCVGIISECFNCEDDPALHSAMLSHAVADFRSRGITTVKCGASTGKQRMALQSLGFALVDIDVPVFHLAPGISGVDPESLMAKDWLLSLGDSDLDQVRPSHQPTFVEIIRILLGKIPGSEHIP